MGAFLTAGLATQLNQVAESGTTNLTVEQAAAFAANPNALIDPQAKASLPPETLDVLQQAMAVSVHKVFFVGAILSILAFFVALFLPKQSSESKEHSTDSDCGEKMFMAEQTTINARNQPEAGFFEG